MIVVFENSSLFIYTIFCLARLIDVDKSGRRSNLEYIHWSFVALSELEYIVSKNMFSGYNVRHCGEKNS